MGPGDKEQEQPKEQPKEDAELAKLRAEVEQLRSLQREKEELKQLRRELAELKKQAERKDDDNDEDDDDRGRDRREREKPKDTSWLDDEEWEKRRDEGQFGRSNKKGYNRRLDVPQAFNFNRTRQEMFGYLTSLTIGTRACQAQFGAQSPLGPSLGSISAVLSAQTAPGLVVVGAIESVTWELGVEDPITFSARISATAKSDLMSAQYMTTAAVEVSVGWVVYEYDLAARQYFVAFSSATSGNDAGVTPVSGQIVKSITDRALELSVGFEPAGEVWAPQNFELEFTMRPKTGFPQQLYLGFSRLGRLNKTWGTARAT